MTKYWKDAAADAKGKLQAWLELKEHKDDLEQLRKAAGFTQGRGTVDEALDVALDYRLKQMEGTPFSANTAEKSRLDAINAVIDKSGVTLVRFMEAYSLQGALARIQHGGKEHVDALVILGHGAPGMQAFGTENYVAGGATLHSGAAYLADISSIEGALKKRAPVYFAGCSVGKGSFGKAFITKASKMLEGRLVWGITDLDKPAQGFEPYAELMTGRAWASSDGVWCYSGGLSTLLEIGEGDVPGALEGFRPQPADLDETRRQDAGRSEKIRQSRR